MRAIDLIRALQEVPLADIIIGDGRILYSQSEDPLEIYVLPIEVSHPWDGRKDKKGLCEKCGFKYTHAWIHAY